MRKYYFNQFLQFQVRETWLEYSDFGLCEFFEESKVAVNLIRETGEEYQNSFYQERKIQEIQNKLLTLIALIIYPGK